MNHNMPLQWGFLRILKNSLHFLFISCIIILYRLVRHSLNKGYNMNKSQIAVNVTISIAFILFFVLLIAGMFTMSIVMIISAFVVGFVGFAIVDHESQVEYENSNNEGTN